MDLDSELLKEELDKLKQRYRKDAMRAVEAADVEGYTRGKNEAMESVSAKISQWKDDARRAVTSADSEGYERGKTEAMETVTAKLTQWKEDARRAVATADSEGYARGTKEAMESVSDKLTHWKAIAEAVQSNDAGQSKPVLLVQYITEQIYKSIKADFSQDSDISMDKIKVLLTIVITAPFVNFVNISSFC
jgi:hypothetical protein